MPSPTITKVRSICCAPRRHPYPSLVIVKVETSEPGLYGLGCASHTFRPLAVAASVDQYLDLLVKGRSTDSIEDIWQAVYASTNTRNGPIMNCALSGLDQALWDIQGKRLGVPVYQLLGGKCRFAVDTYAHAIGRDLEELEENVKRFMAEGYRHIRIELSEYGPDRGQPDFAQAGFASPRDTFVDPARYVVMMPRVFERIRSRCGDQIELLHDMIYTRIRPIDAINMIKLLGPYRPFFIEDPFCIEDRGYLSLLRQQTSIPIALGEKFVNPSEYYDLIAGRLIDFIRCHIPYIGGLTPARKVAALGELFGVRTAWHGPADLSPVGHAANVHLDLATWNFGIQERTVFTQEEQEIFPGCPTLANGYLLANDRPGLGIDLDEGLAARFPIPEDHVSWYGSLRYNDGTVRRH
ncbi:MAG: enolase C-terminal domain-like protein [Candidatus Latescibacterota bacterium]